MNLNKNNYTMEFYTNNPTNLHTPIKKGKLTKKQKIQEIISNLETCIQIEKSKLGGGKGMQPPSYDDSDNETAGYDNYPKNLAYTAEEEVEYKTDYPLTKKQETEYGSSGDNPLASKVSDADEY